MKITRIDNPPEIPKYSPNRKPRAKGSYKITPASTRELQKSVAGREYLAQNGNKRALRGDPLNRKTRQFISWDGEGINYKGKGNPQSYVLFGASTGDYLLSNKGDELGTKQIFELMLRVAKENKPAIHVGFGFNYDVNMMLRDVDHEILIELKDNTDNIFYWDDYRVKYIPHKWFELSKRGATKKDNQSIVIYDIMTFFGTTFVKALEDYLLPDRPELKPVLEQMQIDKDKRKDLEYKNIKDIIRYWKGELELMVDLANQLRKYCLEAGYNLSKWHGPGAIADYIMRDNHISKHMNRDLSHDIIEASQYAFAGGRFEQFYCGRYVGRIFQYDIRSAYPYAITHLPSLANAKWTFRSASSFTDNRGILPLKDFALYHVQFRDIGLDTFHENPNQTHRPEPFFWRDKRDTIEFPGLVTNWVWGVELKAVMKHEHYRKSIMIIEGWELEDSGERPFKNFIETTYALRAKWKSPEVNNRAQIVLKLAMNSIYGKTAQIKGWDEKKKLPPKWHQLEWAGFITAYCRSMIFGAAMQFPDKVIAIETDGIFVTEKLDLQIGTGLGQWEETEYEGIAYVQSGLYCFKTKGKWSNSQVKSRGFNRGSLPPKTILNAANTLKDIEGGRTVRFKSFTSYRKLDTDNNWEHWRAWQESPHVAKWGMGEKRLHITGHCVKCEAKYSNRWKNDPDMDMGEATTAKVPMHNMVIRNPAGGMCDWDEEVKDGLYDIHSYKHKLPWLDKKKNKFWEDDDDYSLSDIAFYDYAPQLPEDFGN